MAVKSVPTRQELLHSLALDESNFRHPAYVKSVHRDMEDYSTALTTVTLLIQGFLVDNDLNFSEQVWQYIGSCRLSSTGPSPSDWPLTPICITTLCLCQTYTLYLFVSAVINFWTDSRSNLCHRPLYLLASDLTLNIYLCRLSSTGSTFGLTLDSHLWLT